MGRPGVGKLVDADGYHQRQQEIDHLCKVRHQITRQIQSSSFGNYATIYTNFLPKAVNYIT
jgi:hypothetical protein